MIKSVKIIVVETNSAVKKLLVDILQFSVNREVLSFDNGIDALNYITKNSDVDMIIFGFDMPGISGTEFTSTIKTKWPHIICIMIADPPYNHEVLMKKPIDAYLNKHFNPKDVFNIVQRFVVDG